MARLGYTWYSKDWKTNEKVFDLSLELRGLYREFIDFAYENDNEFTIDHRYWCRMLGINKRKFDTLFARLVREELILKQCNFWCVPSVEKRIAKIRAGALGGKHPSKQKGKQKGNQIEREKEKETKKERERVKSGFKKPSRDEVWDYFYEKMGHYSQAKIESKIFYDFYESKNWMVGKNKMSKWKAAVSSWLSRKKRKNEGNLTAGEKLDQKLGL